MERVCKYDVFISFRGSDTRNNFTDHLYYHLTRKGTFTFKDDKLLDKGQTISQQLLQAISDSRISIIVFSKDYATSTWCLDEMAAIADCKKDLKQTVFPVFYDVDPSDVRKQSGVYKDAFSLHGEKFKEYPGKVDRWKTALTELASSAGWDLRDKPEVIEIERIVQEVIKTLGRKFSALVDDLIGIQPQVDVLENLLKLTSKDDGFRVLGIWGMGGIGKTTLATVLYDKISYQFDACCFIENTSKIYKDGGAIAVEKQILHQALDEKCVKTYSHSQMSWILRSRLQSIKVLVVLDNIDQLKQLEDLAIVPKLLCKGSRIIITTRDEHILKAYKADAIHRVQLMNDKDARQLLCRKAFNSDDPSNRFVDMIPKVLKYTQGLPLAIRVVGSFLSTRDHNQWTHALKRLGKSPDEEIMDVIRMSLEGLRQDEKEIFMHIACFFKEEREDYVNRILDSCGLDPYIGIPVIIEKSLVTIRNQEIHMHQVLQDLGQEMIREGSFGDQGLWSRLWLYEDFHDVMISKLATNNTKAIVLNQKHLFQDLQLRVEEISKMTSLELLILGRRKWLGRLDSLSNRLRYLMWHGYPCSYLPSSFEPYKLVELNIPNSCIVRLWEDNKIKNLPCLKRMDLSNSKYLVEMPNFEGIPNLERLDLTGCKNLSHVHPSIGLLKELAFLSLRNCKRLTSLDLDSVYNLSSLRILYLSNCIKLNNTPDFTGMSNLEYLDLEGCRELSMIHESIGALVKLKFLCLRFCFNLVTIPSSVNTMTSLTTLDLYRCSKLKNFPLGQRSELEESTYVAISGYVPSSCMGSLVFLDLGNCNLFEIPDAIGELRSLERLNLERNKFASLPDTISGLFCLAYLNLSNCHMLQCLPLLPSTNASSVGRYFVTVSGSRNHRSGLYIDNCPKLVKSDELMVLALAWLTRLVEEPRHFRCGFDIVLDGSVIPEWFNHQFKGGSVIRILHTDVDDNWIGFAFCVAFELMPSGLDFECQLKFLCLSFESENTEERFRMPLHVSERYDMQGRDLERNDSSKHLWLIYISRPHCHFVKTGAHITFKASSDSFSASGLHNTFKAGPDSGLVVKSWGLRMLFKQDIVVMKRNLNYEKERLSMLQKSSEDNPVDDPLHFDYVHEKHRWMNSWFKIPVPYNWLVTEEEEFDDMEAKEKENNLSIIGLGKRRPDYTPSSSGLGSRFILDGWPSDFVSSVTSIPVRSDPCTPSESENLLLEKEAYLERIKPTVTDSFSVNIARGALQHSTVRPSTSTQPGFSPNLAPHSAGFNGVPQNYGGHQHRGSVVYSPNFHGPYDSSTGGYQQPDPAVYSPNFPGSSHNSTGYTPSDQSQKGYGGNYHDHGRGYSICACAIL